MLVHVDENVLNKDLVFKTLCPENEGMACEEQLAALSLEEQPYLPGEVMFVRPPVSPLWLSDVHSLPNSRDWKTLDSTDMELGGRGRDQRCHTSFKGLAMAERKHR